MIYSSTEIDSITSDQWACYVLAVVLKNNGNELYLPASLPVPDTNEEISFEFHTDGGILARLINNTESIVDEFLKDIKIGEG